MENQPLILLVEDDELLARAYISFLLNEPCKVTHAGSGQAALQAINEQPPDILLLDLLLPDMHGLEILAYIRQHKLDTDVIVVTTEASTEVAVEAIKAGALDYLVKPLDMPRLKTTVHNAIERLEMKHRLGCLEVDLQSKRFQQFIGASPVMHVIYRIIENAAASNASVFITGESGTGKELCAEAIHTLSERRDGPLLTLNCAAIPRELMESELFGHVKGAFTGATNSRKGAVFQANGGTLFFDEVCEMDLRLQAKLLRFIQTRRFQPVGGNRIESTDVRFICATNRDPWAEVSAGHFREDLYYRLFVVPIEMPPLRRRDTDILLLANEFLQRFATQANKEFEGFSPEMEKQLLNHPWPGNVRQLQNVLHNLVVMQPGGRVTQEMLTLPQAAQSVDDRQPSTTLPTNPVISSVRSNFPGSGEISPLWKEEKRIIEKAIEQCNGNVVLAAAKLQVSDSTIYRKRKKWLARD